MLPPLEGIIARRILLNFRADPEVVQRLVPWPLQVVTRNGFAVVGVCLIRLERLRPKGLPAALGMSSENMAHRVAIRYPSGGDTREGVFIWRRETDRALMRLLGGRLFPGTHGSANFRVGEGEGSIAMEVRTEGRDADVWFEARNASAWGPTPLFGTFGEACGFFERGERGLSCSRRNGALEGMRLRVGRWEMTPLQVQGVRATFYEDSERFPPGSVVFDCGLMMQKIPHEWHALDGVPELAGVLRGSRP